MSFFVRLIIYVIIGVAAGILFNKFVIKHFSNSTRKVLNVITMVIFILSSISLSVIISIKSYVDSTIRSYSGKIEQYVYNTFQNNDFIINGVDLNKVNNDISQISNAVSGLREMIPDYTELGVNEIIYDILIGSPMEELFNQLNDVNYSIGAYAEGIYAFADRNNFLTVSSILGYFTNFATRKINTVFLGIIISLIIPFFIYIITIFIIIIVKKIK